MEILFQVIIHICLQGATLAGVVKITINPSVGDIYLGESKAFICKVVSGDADDIVWTDPSGEEIADGTDDRVSVRKEEYKSQLEIKAARTEDSGRYTCQITADSGREITEDLHITVIQDPVINSAAVQEFKEGSDAFVQCAVIGIPTPSVSWSYRGGKITPSERHKMEEGGLMIKDVRTSDAGVYECTGRIQERGIETTLPITVNVQYAPVFDTSGTEVLYSWLGGPVNLSCSVHSHPSSDILWERDGVTLGRGAHSSDNSQQTSSTFLVQVDSPDDFSMYTCIATNTVGSETHIVELKEGEQPGIRSVSTGRGETGNSIRLNFQPSDNPDNPVTRHIVHYRESGAVQWSQAVGNGSDPLVLTDLDWAALYEVRVEAETTEGLSAPIFINATTAQRNPAASVGSPGTVGTAAVVGITLGTFLVLLIAVDAACYRFRRSGLLMGLVSTLGRQRRGGSLEPETGGDSPR